MDEWDGKERPSTPAVGISERRLREVLKAELGPIQSAQDEINKKIAQWEFGAMVFRYFIIATMGIFASAAGVVAGVASAWDWVRSHLR